MGKGSGAMVYGLVQYDFKAERPDELEARAGEAIIVIALSNPEWFVAKPIGRLGGPGLIPVSFLELKDMQTGQPVTDPLEAVRRAGVPKVEEWKKMTAEYKNSSITLGKIDSIGGSNGGGGGVMSGVPSMVSSVDKMSMGGHMSQNGNGNTFVSSLPITRTKQRLTEEKKRDIIIAMPVKERCRTTTSRIHTPRVTNLHRRPPSWPPWPRRFRDIVLTTINTGTLSRPRWRTAAAGSCRGFTTTFTTSRSRC